MYRALALLPLVALTNTAFDAVILKLVVADKIPCFMLWNDTVFPPADFTVQTLCAVEDLAALVTDALSVEVAADSLCAGPAAVTAAEYKTTMALVVADMCADSSAVSVSLMATLAALVIRAF